MRNYFILLFLLITYIGFSQTNVNLDSLKNALNSSESDTNKVILLNQLSNLYSKNNSELSLKYVNESLELGLSLNYYRGIATSHRIKGYIFYNQNKYKEAISSFLNSINYYKNYKSYLIENNEDNEKLANMYNTMGVIFYYQANYEKALEYYSFSIEIFELLGNKNGISNCYNNIGIIYNNLNELSKALNYHFKSLSIKFDINDKQGIATSYNNIGEIYRSQNLYDKALFYYYKSLQIKDSINDLSGISTSCNNIGFIYLEKNNFDSAFYFLKRSINISLELKDKFDISESYLNYGNYFSKLKNNKEAIKYYKQSYQIALEIGAPELMKASSEKLIELFKAISDYKRAYEYFVINKKISEQLYNEENIKKLAQLEAKQEFLQKEKNAEFVAKQKEIIQKSKFNRQRIISYASLIGLALTILLIFVIFRNYKNKNHANIELQIQKAELNKEKKLSDKLLLNVLPADIAEELKKYGKASVKQYKMASVMFTDFTGFTMLCEKITPIELINELDIYFEKIDSIIEKNKIEKIKTIGDAYMCAGGIPIANRSNPIDTIIAAIEIQKYLLSVNREKKLQNLPLWTLRIGIHTGNIVAGVIGKNKFAYDVWGDTVNVAARMEASGEAGKVNISGETYSYVMNYFECTYRGKIEAKNKGEIDMYFVDRIKHEFSADEEGFAPNSHLLSVIKELNKT